MKFKTEKNLRIINELMSFCYHFSSRDISVNIKTVNNKSTITVDALIYKFPKNDYDNLIQTLNIPRQHEVEQYYWQLGGESEFDCELSLVGMMVDNAKVQYENNILHIELERIETS
ncbi:hypothetical protein ACFO6R_09510 [Eubacterium multiforme]|uniref:Hsp20/alpha crystallin family protein n=1 Tax=Eubacterium multiforme TaxID=83339 RepID=A0ABT9UT69_9FIRM|nr:hypothetical protein [Eubacterium multiforme]MDQ0149484.1 hypothetical protein [Eubacterium multiforme]